MSTSEATIDDLLKPGNVRYVEHIDHWQDAIRVAVKPLEEGGFVEPWYAENIIADTQSLGPYYVLTEDVALIHARPEEGALSKQLAVTVTRDPVIFNEDAFPVRILFALAAEDSNSHIEAIKLLANVCMDERRVQEIASSTDTSEIYRLLTEAVK